MLVGKIDMEEIFNLALAAWIGPGELTVSQPRSTDETVRKGRVRTDERRLTLIIFQFEHPLAVRESRLKDGQQAGSVRRRRAC